MTRASLVVLLLVFAARTAHARELVGLPDAPGADRVYVVTAIDPAIASGVGYAHVLSIAQVPRELTLSADLTAPWFAFDGHHYRLDGGVRVPLVRHRNFRLAGRVHLEVSGGKNWVHTATALGLEGSLVAGYVRPRFFVDVELGIAYTPLTYLTHSQQFRDSQYADVVDGWYAGTEGRLAVAVEGGARVNACWELGLRVGRYTSLAFAAPQGLPYVADLFVTRRF